MDHPSPFEALYKAPIHTLNPHLLSSLQCSPCKRVLVDSSTPLLDSRVEEVSSLDSQPKPFLRKRFEDLSHCSSLFLR